MARKKKLTSEQHLDQLWLMIRDRFKSTEDKFMVWAALAEYERLLRRNANRKQ